MISFNKRVAKVLEESGVVTAEQIRECVDVAESSSRHVSSVLIERELVDEGSLLGLLASASRVPPIHLEHVEPDPSALEALPAELAFDYDVFPVSKIGQILTIALTNPYDVVKLDDVRIVTGCELRLVLTLEDHLRHALDVGYRSSEKEVEELLGSLDEDGDLELKEGENDLESLDLDAISDHEGSPVIKFVNVMIYQAAKMRASDIHIEPFERTVSVRFRKDGVMSEQFSPPRRMLNAIVSRIKVISQMDIAERRKPQDGKFQMRIDGRQVDFRVSVLPMVHGEKVVLRLLDASNLQLSLDALGFEDAALNDFRYAIAQPYGMILVTGPTGSGKSTTLYSAVKEMLSPEENFVTVEDPVEYQLHGVNQVQVQPKRGLTFASALRAILRQDPDKILLGEIRDKETIDIAVKAALTGHLVLSTLHTNDAPSTITRMVDMGVDPFMVASSTLLVSAQRLCRKLCSACREPIEMPTEERLREIGMEDDDFSDDMVFYRPKGCPRCTNGYSGRFAVLETLPMTEDIKRIVIRGGSSADIKRQALENKMITLRRCGLRAAAQGRSSIEEILRVTLLDRKGTGES
jgi:type IV pilus assembly protein PilB